MEWSQQFEILHKIISQRLSEQGKKGTMKNASAFLGIPEHKYQAWKGGQRPVTEDLRMLAQEFEFNPDWLLIGKGKPVQPRKNDPFDPKYVEICDTLHELVRSLPDRLPKIAEVGGLSTTDLYNYISAQEIPPSEAIAKWILHYRINANFLLAQIGQPFLTEEQFRESGPLDFVRSRRGDSWELDDHDSEIIGNETYFELKKKLEEAREHNEFLAKEIVQLNKERRSLQEKLDAMSNNIPAPKA
ncbi:MAG: hypothetical protein OSJ28_10535 [Desulfovibrio sp.]|jgi:hypothetical protein|nr:hypothetical protein [Desulfovibrio sp.]